VVSIFPLPSPSFPSCSAVPALPLSYFHLPSSSQPPPPTRLKLPSLSRQKKTDRPPSLPFLQPFLHFFPKNQRHHFLPLTPLFPAPSFSFSHSPVFSPQTSSTDPPPRPSTNGAHHRSSRSLFLLNRFFSLSVAGARDGLSRDTTPSSLRRRRSVSLGLQPSLPPTGAAPPAPPRNSFTLARSPSPSTGLTRNRTDQEGREQEWNRLEKKWEEPENRTKNRTKWNLLVVAFCFVLQVIVAINAGEEWKGRRSWARSCCFQFSPVAREPTRRQWRWRVGTRAASVPARISAVPEAFPWQFLEF